MAHLLIDGSRFDHRWGDPFATRHRIGKLLALKGLGKRFHTSHLVMAIRLDEVPEPLRGRIL